MAEIEARDAVLLLQKDFPDCLFQAILVKSLNLLSNSQFESVWMTFYYDASQLFSELSVRNG